MTNRHNLSHYHLWKKRRHLFPDRHTLSIWGRHRTYKRMLAHHAVALDQVLAGNGYPAVGTLSPGATHECVNTSSAQRRVSTFAKSEMPWCRHAHQTLALNLRNFTSIGRSGGQMTISKPLHFFFDITHAAACVPIAFYKNHGHLVHLSHNFRWSFHSLVRISTSVTPIEYSSDFASYLPVCR
jgi:hypothetical protein